MAKRQPNVGILVALDSFLYAPVYIAIEQVIQRRDRNFTVTLETVTRRGQKGLSISNKSRKLGVEDPLFSWLVSHTDEDTDYQIAVGDFVRASNLSRQTSMRIKCLGCLIGKLALWTISDEPVSKDVLDKVGLMITHPSPMTAYQFCEFYYQKYCSANSPSRLILTAEPGQEVRQFKELHKRLINEKDFVPRTLTAAVLTTEIGDKMAEESLRHRALAIQDSQDNEEGKLSDYFMTGVFVDRESRDMHLVNELAETIFTVANEFCRMNRLVDFQESYLGLLEDFYEAHTDFTPPQQGKKGLRQALATLYEHRNIYSATQDFSNSIQNLVLPTVETWKLLYQQRSQKFDVLLNTIGNCSSFDDFYTQCQKAFH